MFKVLQIISLKVVEINGSSTLVPICHHTNANLFDQSILLFASFLFIYNVYIHIFLQFRIILLDEFLCFTSTFEANVPEYIHDWSPTRHRRLYFVFLRVFHWGIRAVSLSIWEIIYSVELHRNQPPFFTTCRARTRFVSCENNACRVTTN